MPKNNICSSYLFQQSPVDYVYDTVEIADNFYYSALIILRKANENMSLFTVAGYLAAHAAELYMKSYLIYKDPSRTLYQRFRKINPKHDLEKLLEIIIDYDKEATKFSTKIINLNKYSGDKARFAEYGYDVTAPQDYGTDEIWPITEIKNYFRIKAYK